MVYMLQYDESRVNDAILYELTPAGPDIVIVNLGDCYRI